MRNLAISALAFTLAIGGAACGGDDDGGGSAASFCEQARVLSESEADPTDVEAIEQLRDATDAAPAEIRDDLEQLVDALEQFNDDPEAAEEIFADTELIEASENITQYLEDECGIDTDDEGDGDDTGEDATVDE